MNIYLIRHGESMWNKEQRVQGREDPGLSAAGKRQAKAAAKRLKKEGIKVVYSSDLRRAAQTAKTIADTARAKVVLMPELEEMILGAWQGKTIEEVKKYFPKSYAAWKRSPSKARIPGWEGVPKFTARVRRAFRSIIGNGGDGNVCIVAHWGVIAAYFSIVMKTDFDRFFKSVRIDNCSINKISYKNGKAIIQCINDTKHLH
jgi:broad specificity phosphatase PhoE